MVQRGKALKANPGTPRRGWIGWGSVGFLVLVCACPWVSAQEKPMGETPLCATPTCHVSIVERKSLHAPVQERKCLDCHEYVSATEHTFRLITPKEQLCARCHDLNEKAIVHKPVSDGRCLDCHDVHGSEQPSLLLDTPGKLCVRCHKQDFTKRNFVHGPVAVGACVVCHDSHSSANKGLLFESQDRLCLSCHDDKVPKAGSVNAHLHAPMANGCTSCHDPHAGDYQFQLTKEVPALCLTCHEGVGESVRTMRVKHGPVLEPGGCTTCHTPHFSELPKLQRASQPGLCLSCHDQTLDATDGSPLTNMGELLAENPDHHGPIREGACSACHRPHGGDKFRLLYLAYPKEFYAEFDDNRYQLCFSCHLEKLVLDKDGTGLTGFRDGDLNLHWIHVNREKGRTCRACHEVHASKRPFHIRETVPFGRGGWELPINFEKRDDGGTCTPGCHKARAYSRISPSTANRTPRSGGGS